MFFKQVSVLCTAFILFGCEKTYEFVNLCEENPNLCQEFTKDSWCKSERIAVAFANLSHINKPSEENKFNQLINYEKYEKCMDLASKIEHIKLKDKKTSRIANTNKARLRIKTLSEETKGLKHPNLLYFHWSRYLDNNALNHFLAMEGSDLLETPSLQFNLATYYAKKDQNKTLHFLYHALELTNNDEPINTEIFKSISTIFTDKHKPKQAYIWSKIQVLHTPLDQTITNTTLNEYAKRFNLDHTFLDAIAQKTLKTILNGKFKAPK